MRDTTILRIGGLLAASLVAGPGVAANETAPDTLVLKALGDLPNDLHTIDDYCVCDVGFDNERELVVIETGRDHPLMPILSVCRIAQGSREVLWESEKLWYARDLLVGDLDNDGKREIVLYGLRLPSWQQEHSTMKLIRRAEVGFEVVEFSLSGRVGLIADVNEDGKNELVLGRVRWLGGDSEGLDPMTLEIYRWNGASFDLLDSIPSPNAISKIDFGDLNGDGLGELVCEENGFNSEVERQITSYQYDPASRSFVRLFSQNRIAEEAWSEKVSWRRKTYKMKVVRVGDRDRLLLAFRHNMPNRLYEYSEASGRLEFVEDTPWASQVRLGNKPQLIDCAEQGCRRMVELEGNKLIFRDAIPGVRWNR